jgi:hypothetical protein
MIGTTKLRNELRQARRAKILLNAQRRVAKEADRDRRAGIEPRYLALRDAPLPWARNAQHASLPPAP